VIASIVDLIVPIAKLIGQAIHELEEPMLPIVAAFVAPIVAGCSAQRRRWNSSPRAPAGVDAATPRGQDARTMRDLNTKRLSPGQAETCVLAGVLPIAAYREALRLDGYDEESVLALELLLETKLNANADVEKLRKQKADEAAAAKQAAADAAKKKADDSRATRARSPRLAGALQRAVVRGLIPASRYAEVLTPQYDGDTVDTMLALVEQERADYRRAAEESRRRGEARDGPTHRRRRAPGGVPRQRADVGSGPRAADRAGFDAGDAEILLATMRARKADLDAAKQQRADAAAKAKTKSIDLGPVRDARPSRPPYDRRVRVAAHVARLRRRRRRRDGRAAPAPDRRRHGGAGRAGRRRGEGDADRPVPRTDPPRR
jgi:hypothetical protein